MTRDARFCPYCGCVLNTTAGDGRICHGVEHPADQPREFPPPADRLTVEEVFVEARRIFALLAVNLDHDHLGCDRASCQHVFPDDETAFQHVVLRLAGDQVGGLSAIKLCLLCDDCRDAMNQSQPGAVQLNPKAPAIDELLADSPADLPEGL